MAEATEGLDGRIENTAAAVQVLKKEKPRATEELEQIKLETDKAQELLDFQQSLKEWLD